MESVARWLHRLHGTEVVNVAVGGLSRSDTLVYSWPPSNIEVSELAGAAIGTPILRSAPSGRHLLSSTMKQTRHSAPPNADRDEPCSRHRSQMPPQHLQLHLQALRGKAQRILDPPSAKRARTVADSPDPGSLVRAIAFLNRTIHRQASVHGPCRAKLRYPRRSRQASSLARSKPCLAAGRDRQRALRKRRFAQCLAWITIAAASPTRAEGLFLQCESLEMRAAWDGGSLSW